MIRAVDRKIGFFIDIVPILLKYIFDGSSIERKISNFYDLIDHWQK